MKKISLILTGMVLMFASCNHTPEFDGFEGYHPGNLVKLQLTYGGTYTGNKAFNPGEDDADKPDAVAKIKIEEWLNENYYSVEKGSEATVKYNVLKQHSTTSEITNLNVDFERAVVDGAATSIPDWVNFMVAGDEVKSAWVDKAYDGNVYTQCGNTGTDTESWFISPKINVKKGDNLSFDVNVGYYKGNVLSVLISENYAGAASSKNLSKAKWNDVTDKFDVPQEPTDKYGTMAPAGTLDLSSYVGKDIYIAFKYVGSKDLSTTIQLDNIKVSHELTVTESSVETKEARAVTLGNDSKWTVTLPSVIAEVVLDETFEGGVAYENLALDGWLNATLQGTYYWQYRSYSNNMYVQQSANKHEGVLESWLITPILNLEQDMILAFQMKLGYYNGDGFSLLVSEDFNGEAASIASATWTDLTSNLTIDKSSTGGYDSNWSEHKVDLSAYTGKKVYIAFKYLGNGTKGESLVSTTYQIDNVYVGISK